MTGSITLCHALIEAGLVDEYRLFVHPAVQDAAGGCFPTGRASPGCVVDSREFRSGIVLMTYAADA